LPRGSLAGCANGCHGQHLNLGAGKIGPLERPVGEAAGDRLQPVVGLMVDMVGRGGGNLSLNEDAAINMGGDPSLAYLQGDQAAWPDSLQQGIDYRFNSYRFDDNGHLTFNYQLDQVIVEDQITPGNDGRELERSMIFRNNGSVDDLFFRVAKGEGIKWLPNNLYQVDDKTFFIKMDRATRNKAWIRNTGNGQELVVPVSDSDEFSLHYSYIW
jgi:hypothetical protein